ncbi:MAG: HD domain-containing protein [Nitrospirota bacterium]
MYEIQNSISLYEGMALISDPIHRYISFSVPVRDDHNEKTEKDLIDTEWMQRLRYIYQLQSARWVYPSAEHSRFQHSLGVMHVADRFARHLYPFLKDVLTDTPSEQYIVELLRITGLLHDIGHGCFGHFFDENYLDEYGITHEVIGKEIIINELGEMIKKIHRSPYGEIRDDEELNPEYIAFLINKNEGKDNNRDYPEWLLFLKPLFSGIYTVDNLDYVLRDSYMCGVAVGPVDLHRLMHYSFFTDKGLTVHKSGLPALTMFLNARFYLYFNVYYHRTTRAIDLHLKEIFRDTLKYILSGNPIKDLKRYLYLTDWSLLEDVKKWGNSDDKEIAFLSLEWERILKRDMKWKMAFDTTLSFNRFEKGRRVISSREFDERIRDALSIEKKDCSFCIDMASQDPRPLNPLMMGDRQLYVYEPSTRSISTELLKEYFDYIPAKVIQCRIFATNHNFDKILSRIAENILNDAEDSIIGTNI